jgi:elongation factor P hydroxylase
MTCAETGWQAPPDVFISTRLERVFNTHFSGPFNTCLVGGADEPLYRPAQRSGESHVLSYRSDYFASALHEVAHWCIAGARRRELLDFGYWYAPEGRDLDQQRAFEAVESLDNLELASQQAIDSMAFQRAVLQQAKHWQASGLPERAGVFYRALCNEFGTTVRAENLHFSLVDLA